MSDVHPVTQMLFDAARNRAGRGELLRALVPHRGVLRALGEGGETTLPDGRAALFTSTDALEHSGFEGSTEPCPDWLDLDIPGVLWDGGTPSQFSMGAEDLETCRAFRRSLAAERALVRPAGPLGARRLLDAPYVVGLDVAQDPARTAVYETAEGVRLLLVFTTSDLFQDWAADTTCAPVDYSGAGLCGFMADADDIDGVCFNPEGPAGPVVVGPAFFEALARGEDPRTEPMPARSVAEIRLWLAGRRPDVSEQDWVHSVDRVEGALAARYADGPLDEDGTRTYAFSPVEASELPATLGPILDPGWVLQAASEAPPQLRAQLYHLLREDLDEGGFVRRGAFHDARQAGLRRMYPDRFHVRAMV